MERGLGRKVSGITFDKNAIEKTVTSKRIPSTFWRMDSYKNNTNGYETDVPTQAVEEPNRNDIKITGSVIRKL